MAAAFFFRTCLLMSLPNFNTAQWTASCQKADDVLNLLTFSSGSRSASPATPLATGATGAIGQQLPFIPAFPPSPELKNERIPRKLLFTYKFNLLSPKDSDLNEREQLLRQNVRDTIHLFAHDIAPEDVHFWEDSDCLSALEQLGIKIFKKKPHVLVDDFNVEQVGAVKADICRLAMLYTMGGYYFDADIIPQPSLKEQLLSNATFVTVRAMGSGTPKNCLFQAFLAAVPKHPVLLRSIQKFVKFYEDLEGLTDTAKDNLRRNTCGWNIGTALLRQSFDEWANAKTDDLVFTHGKEHVSQFFTERRDDSLLKDYSGVPSHLSGALCDYSVVDETSKRVVMFSRIYDQLTQRLCVEEAQRAGERQAIFVHISQENGLMCYN